MIFTRVGFSALKFAYGVLIAGIAVGTFIVLGSYFYWQSEMKDDRKSQRDLQDLQGRVSTAKLDREDVRGAADAYQGLLARGVFLSEERFDLIDALAVLKLRHQLITLNYDITPQRPLRLSTGTVYSGVNLFASRVKLKITALHDADLLSFLDEFPRLQRGFFPLDRCVIKRAIAVQAVAVAPIVNAPNVSNGADDDEPTPRLPAARVVAASPLPLEAECSLEWISLQAKGDMSPPLPISGKANGVRPQ